MKLDIPLNFNKEKIIQNGVIFWRKTYKGLFAFLLVVSVFFGGYVWNKNLNSSTWDNKKIQEFIAAQDKGVIFLENDYAKALEVVKQRSEKNAKIPDVGKDFFRSF